MRCTFGGGADPVTATAVYYDAAANPEVHVFGTDSDNETFCCIEELTTATATNWYVEFTGKGTADTFSFDTQGYTMSSYDEQVSTTYVSVFGGAGDDTVTLPNNNYGLACYVDAGADDDTVTGSPVSDIIFGMAGDDVIDGLNGSDFIDGGADEDIIDGGEGLDTLCGGGWTAGPDSLAGGPGNDLLWGGHSGGGGYADLDCGIGTDTYGDEGGGAVTDCEYSTTTAPTFCL